MEFDAFPTLEKVTTFGYVPPTGRTGPIGVRTPGLSWDYPRTDVGWSVTLGRGSESEDPGEGFMASVGPHTPQSSGRETGSVPGSYPGRPRDVEGKVDCPGTRGC